jgi:replication-associated recombination protein RarA
MFPSMVFPKHLCNAPTGLMNDLGYGEGYRYAHNEQDAVAKGQTYFPNTCQAFSVISNALGSALPMSSEAMANSRLAIVFASQPGLSWTH